MSDLYVGENLFCTQEQIVLNQLVFNPKHWVTKSVFITSQELCSEKNPTWYSCIPYVQICSDIDHGMTKKLQSALKSTIEKQNTPDIMLCNLIELTRHLERIVHTYLKGLRAIIKIVLH